MITDGDPASAVPGDGPAREAARQAWLLQALRGAAPPADAAAWLAGTPQRRQQGLQVHRAHAAATAARALAAAYPTVGQLLGGPAFAQLAQALWHAAPPQRGDLAQWGADLPDFMAASAQLAGEPYLADLARLEWALHGASQAADDAAPAAGLPLLGTADPAGLWLELRPGHSVLRSRYPVHTLWAAHQADGSDRFAAARQALAAGQAEAVRVARDGLAAGAERIDEATAVFERAVLQRAPLAAALEAAGPAFDVGAWLVDSLRGGRLAAVRTTPPA